jgi:hypothetical protein
MITNNDEISQEHDKPEFIQQMPVKLMYSDYMKANTDVRETTWI